MEIGHNTFKTGSNILQGNVSKMSNKHIDEYFTQEEWGKFEAPLIKVDPILKEFAKKNKFNFRNTWPHDWIRRQLNYVKKNKTKHYYLDMTIIVDPKKESKDIFKYSFWINVSNRRYPNTISGIIQALYNAVIYFLFREKKSFKYLYWHKTLEEFVQDINPERLKQLLEEARCVLDNFDESLLQG